MIGGAEALLRFGLRRAELCVFVAQLSIFYVEAFVFFADAPELGSKEAIFLICGLATGR